MVVKKKNIFCVSLTAKAVLCLQQLGYLDGKKKTTCKNLSHFFSELICDFIETGDSDMRRLVQQKMLLLEMKVLERERVHIESKMRKVAVTLSSLKVYN